MKTVPSVKKQKSAAPKTTKTTITKKNATLTAAAATPVVKKAKVTAKPLAAKAKTAKPGSSKKPQKRPEVKIVEFTCNHQPHAREVHLAGSFNNWTPVAMSYENGRVQLTLELVPGEYQYKFVVDGDWQNDPEAEQAIMNDFGSLNSLLKI